MFPKYHVISSALLSVILYPFLALNVLWVFFAGFLIDVDHYIYYVLKFKSFNLKKAYKYFEEYEKKRHFKDVLCIFHTIEFFILLLILSFYNKIIFLIFIGIIFHEILDLIDMYIKKLWEARALSFIMWLIRNL
ncbi:MAG: hypothetical protein V1815_02725 [Candidatus Woesearchaeota archaeon]